MRHRLRLFTGDEVEQPVEAPRISVRLGDVADALADAARRHRTWLEDFDDEQVEISADLYDILSAYIHLRPGA